MDTHTMTIDATDASTSEPPPMESLATEATGAADQPPTDDQASPGAPAVRPAPTSDILPPTPEPPNRGALEVEMIKPSQPIVAGRKFALTLRIKNPFDVPITLRSVTTQLSPEFQERVVKPPEQKRKVWDRLWSQSESLLLGNTYARSLEPPGPEASDRDEPEAVTLQPRSQTLQSFTLKTRNATLFTPSTYDFAFQVVYEVDGVERRDAAFTQLNIQAPLSAMLAGAAIGALCGLFLRNVGAWDPGTWWTGLSEAPVPQILGMIATAAGSVIAALIGVVAFGRQKSAQPFITIEDFYGGLFVGFVAGYTGSEFLDMFKNVGAPAGAGAAAPPAGG
jgi:hypothetical protein